MRTFNAVLYLSFFPLAVVSLLAMAAWSVEDFLKEIQLPGGIAANQAQCHVSAQVA